MRSRAVGQRYARDRPTCDAPSSQNAHMRSLIGRKVRLFPRVSRSVSAQRERWSRMIIVVSECSVVACSCSGTSRIRALDPRAFRKRIHKHSDEQQVRGRRVTVDLLVKYATCIYVNINNCSFQLSRRSQACGQPGQDSASDLNVNFYDAQWRGGREWCL